MQYVREECEQRRIAAARVAMSRTHAAQAGEQPEKSRRHQEERRADAARSQEERCSLNEIGRLEEDRVEVPR